MQLVKTILLTYLTFFSIVSFAQDQNGSKDNIEVDFLFDYYEQDGDHAAVTGGIGTQKLNDIVSQIVVNVPFKNGNSLSISGGFDAYSSASSQNIDPIRTGASGNDIRAHAEGNYTFAPKESNSLYRVSLGLSTEFDYQSISIGGSWTNSSDNGNREFSISGQYFYDNISLIYPIELRSFSDMREVDEWSYKSDNRFTYSFSTTYSQVLTKRLQASLNLDFVYQTGYLSTPFHRVYFTGETAPRIESLPNSRYKVPLGLRLNYFVTDYLVTRLHYRYYHDDFGIDANTFEVELPIKLTNSFTVSPFYRYHDQSGSKYFSQYNQSIPSDEFYTSDYDLSNFSSQKYGLGLKYYPLFGLTEFSPPILDQLWTLKSIDLRAGYYEQTTGLNAFNISLGFSFIIR